MRRESGAAAMVGVFRHASLRDHKLTGIHHVENRSRWFKVTERRPVMHVVALVCHGLKKEIKSPPPGGSWPQHGRIAAVRRILDCQNGRGKLRKLRFLSKDLQSTGPSRI